VLIRKTCDQAQLLSAPPPVPATLAEADGISPRNLKIKGIVGDDDIVKIFALHKILHEWPDQVVEHTPGMNRHRVGSFDRTIHVIKIT
jgi:hypothetical protein